MSKNNYYTSQDGSFVQDIIHLFLDSDEEDTLKKFIKNMEEKEFKNIKKNDVTAMLLKLRSLADENESQSNQIQSLNSDLAEQKRLNMEMAIMVEQLKETGKQDPETTERIQSVIRAFRNDKFSRLFFFDLDGEEVAVTQAMMKQIVSWYPKGRVYFTQGTPYKGDISTDKEYKYTFGELALWNHRTDSSKNCEVLIIGETAQLVHVLFLEDFKNEEEGVLAPTCVIHSKITKLKGNLAVHKQTVFNFMLNMGYSCPVRGLG